MSKELKGQKAKNIESHKMVALTELLLDSFEKMGYVEMDTIVMGALRVVKNFSEDLVESAFKVKGVSDSTYLQEYTNKLEQVIDDNLFSPDLQKKVDTMARKNYKPVKEL